MSLLLDALNKADKERQKKIGSPSIDSNHVRHVQQKPSAKIIIIGCVLAALVASITSYFVLTSKINPAQSNSSITAKAKNSTEIAFEISNENNSVPTNATASVSLSNINRAQDSLSTTPKIESTKKIADLYQKTAPHTLVSQTDSANTQTVQTNVDSTNSISQFANIPELHDLPDTLLAKIPSMNYSEHHFNKLTANNQGGSVMINGSLKHINDQLVPGVYLDKILEDGIVLHFENYSFKMHALNSWVNM